MTTPLSRIAALFVLNRWYQNEADRARDAYARPEKVWRRCVAEAWRLKSPTEDRMRFPQATLVDRGVPRVNHVSFGILIESLKLVFFFHGRF